MGMILLGAVPFLGAANYVSEYFIRKNFSKDDSIIQLLEPHSRDITISTLLLDGFGTAAIITGEPGSALAAFSSSAIIRAYTYLMDNHLFRDKDSRLEYKGTFPLGGMIKASFQKDSKMLESMVGAAQIKKGDDIDERY